MINCTNSNPHTESSHREISCILLTNSLAEYIYGGASIAIYSENSNPSIYIVTTLLPMHLNVYGVIGYPRIWVESIPDILVPTRVLTSN